MDLKEQYEKETGNDWKMNCSTEQPTTNYVKWLEQQLRLCGVGKQSELLPYSDAEITKQAFKNYGSGQKGCTYEQNSAYVKGAIDYREGKIERI